MTNNSNNPTVSDLQKTPSTKAVKNRGDRLGYNYVVLKSLKKSQKNDVVKCFYMKSIVKFGFCVIKEGSINDAKDRFGRDIKERLVWQQNLHQSFGEKIRIPKFIGAFEENGKFYLAIEYISGSSLAKLFQKKGELIRHSLEDGSKYGVKIVNYLIQCASILRDMHRLKLVHRDATAGNFMVSSAGKVYTIDLELTYSIESNTPNPHYLLGTHGFMSPEQLERKTPTEKEDVFAFGAILLNAWTNLSPLKITEPLPHDLIDKLNYFVKDLQISKLITGCLSNEPEKRPDMDYIIGILNTFATDIKKKVKRVKTEQKPTSLQEISSVIQSAIDTLASPLFSDPDNGWFAENVNHKNRESNSLSKGWYTSFHIGGAGILYFLSKAKMLGYDVSKNKHNIEKLIALADKKYIQAAIPPPGLHFGSHGIAVSFLYALESDLLNNHSQITQWIHKLSVKDDSGTLDIMNGLAGQLLALMLIYKQLPVEQTKDILTGNVQYIISAQKIDGSWTRKNEKKRTTKGFAFGVAGIAYALLEYGHQFDDHASLKSAESALGWLIENAKWNAGSVYWMSSLGKKVAPWWLDGAPGVALAFLKAYEITQNEVYKRYFLSSLAEYSIDSRDNNFSQTNGMSGLGEIYIEAYKVLKDNIWIHKAQSIAELFMKSVKCHSYYGKFWLTENQFAVPGFMLGNAGILHFLMRYLNHEKIAMPMAIDLPELSIKNSPAVTSHKQEISI